MRAPAIALMLAMTMPAALTAAPEGPSDAPVANAAMRGDVDAVRSLLREGADVNAPQSDGMTALHWTALEGGAEMAEMLVYAGANLEAGTRIGGYTPLHLASRAANAAVAAALLRAGAAANAATTSGGAKPLHFAAAGGDVAMIDVLLDGGADVDGVDSAWEQTPLMFAAASNRVDAVKELLRRGADVAAAAKVVDVVALEKADKDELRRRSRQREALRALEAEDDEDQGEAAEGEEAPEGKEQGEEKEVAEGEKAPVDEEVAGENVAPGEKPAAKEKAGEGEDAESGNKPAEDGKPAAAEKVSEKEKPAGDEKVAEERPPEGGEKAESAEGEIGATSEDAEEGEKAGGDEDDVPEEEKRPPTYGELVGGHGGLTALLYAAREGHVETTMALLDAGADINQVSGGDGTSPMLIATLNGHFDLAVALLERGADPDLASDAGATPLYGALNVRWAPRSAYPQQNAYTQQRTGYLDLMAALLDAGADPDVRLTKHLWYTSFNFDHLLNTAGATPFWRAAYATDVEAMRLLVAHGADPNIPTRKLPSRGRPRPQGEDGNEDEEADPSGLPEVPVGGPAVYPIHAASGAGYGDGFAGYAHQHVPGGWLPTVEYLVEELGADVNARDDKAFNAVHHAAARGDFEMVLYLVSHGADPTAVSRKGQTTADMANGPVQRIQPFPRTVWLLEHLGSENNDNCVSC